MHVWLVGMMGSGKSVTAVQLARRLGWNVVDLDREIERSAGASVRDIFRSRGEAAFRVLEGRALVRAARRPDPAVIATGGGAVLSEANVDVMRASGCVVWLQAPPAVLARRTRGSTRPLLGARDRRRGLARLARERRHRYRRAAQVTVSTRTRTPAQVAAVVEREVRPAPIVLRAGRDTSTIHVGNGTLARAGAWIREAIGGALAIVVTDSHVVELHAAPLERSLRGAGYRTRRIVVPAGERHKNAATVRSIWKQLLDAGADRSTPVVALGGGVVGDLAGFAAATFMRGLPLVQVPTTVVAQVDSAIGGKTGFDLPEGKNLVGAFKHAALVIADVALLETLPEREFRAGLGEVIKYAAIADARLFAALERAAGRLRAEPASLERVIRRCAELKSRIVARAPVDRGGRGILNFGHTLGHAIEARARFRGVLHGEAVALGMLGETRFAVSAGYCSREVHQRLDGLVRDAGLLRPVRRKGSLVSYVGRDKKRVEGDIALPVLTRIGHARVLRVRVEKLAKFLDSEGY